MAGVRVNMDLYFPIPLSATIKTHLKALQNEGLASAEVIVKELQCRPQR